MVAIFYNTLRQFGIMVAFLICDNDSTFFLMDAVKDTYFKRNAASVAIVEFFWGLGFPVIIESTFLQIFLKKIGASDLMIGLVPAILIAGFSILPVMSSYLTRNTAFQKNIVLNLHLVSSCATLGYGMLLFFIQDTALVLPAFFISYVIFSVSIGLTFPVWLHFLVKIFSPKKSIQGLSTMYLAQNIAKLLSSIFILKVIEVYALSLTSAAWIFFGSGIVFLAGSVCFVFTKELPYKTKIPHTADSFVTHTRQTIVEIIQNRNLLLFLAADLDNYIIMTVISFYAVYATQFHGISDHTAAGLFVTFIYSGAILSNLLLGTFQLLNMKFKFLLTKVLGFLALAALIFLPNTAGFLFSSLLMGFCRGTRSLIYSPCIKQFSDKEDTTAIFAAAPLLTIFFGSGFPALFGKSLDWLAFLGSASYKLMFAVSMCIILITFIFGIHTNFNIRRKNTP